MEHDFDPERHSSSRKLCNSYPIDKITHMKLYKHFDSCARINHNARRKSSGLLKKHTEKLKLENARINSNIDSSLEQITRSTSNTIPIDMGRLDKHERGLIHAESIISDYEHAHLKSTVKQPYYRPIAIAARRRDVIVSKSRRDRDLSIDQY
jgi:hypothetical protein